MSEHKDLLIQLYVAVLSSRSAGVYSLVKSQALLTFAGLHYVPRL